MPFNICHAFTKYQVPRTFLFANSLYKTDKHVVVYKMFSYYHNSTFIEMSCEVDIHFNR